jgi:hypothetical protein
MRTRNIMMHMNAWAFALPVFVSVSLGMENDVLIKQNLGEPTASPYELNWPASHLPLWAKKKEEAKYDVSADEEICFVHVGKTAGSTIGCLLGFSLHCQDTSPVQGMLVERTTNTFHADVYDCSDESSYFLFAVRDPIERARSAFNYDRPEFGWQYNSRFHCPFFYFEDFVEVMSGDADTSVSCKRIANDAIKGVNPHGPSHFYYNYQYYLEGIPGHAPILVIRNEHLELDWRITEMLVGGNGDNEVSFPRNNVNLSQSPEDYSISDKSRASLCELLCNEIQSYKKILRRAENLDEEQLQVSLEELESKCPVEAVTDECPEPLPDIRDKLEGERGYGSHHDWSEFEDKNI